MTADEAREITNKHNFPKVIKALETIHEKAESGECSVTFTPKDFDIPYP